MMISDQQWCLGGSSNLGTLPVVNTKVLVQEGHPRPGLFGVTRRDGDRKGYGRRQITRCACKTPRITFQFCTKFRTAGIYNSMDESCN